MKVFWNKDYTSVNYNFDTTKKSDNIVEIIKSKELDNIKIVDPSETVSKSLVDLLIGNHHDQGYISALVDGKNLNLAESSGFDWDENTYAFARAHTHGLIASVKDVITNGGRSGSLSSGLHHARPESGNAFCTINGVALSAFYAVQSGKNVVILDFDAHCGGGTFAHISKFLEENPEYLGKISQVDVSTNWFDSYGFGDEYFVDQETPEWASLMVMSQKTDYIEMIKLGLQVAETYRNENTVVIYNAGTDPLGYWGIDELVLAEREKLVSEWIGDTPAVFALAGGYSGKNFDRNDVARTHLLNINEWAWKTSNK